MWRTHWKVKKKRIFFICSPFKKLDCLCNHEGLIFDRAHLFHHSVLLDDRSDVPGMSETIKIVKSQRVGTARHSIADNEFSFRLGSTFRFWLVPIQTQMPFPNARGGITILLQKRSQSETGRRYDRRRKSVQHTELPDPVRVTSRKESISGRRAVGS